MSIASSSPDRSSQRLRQAQEIAAQFLQRLGQGEEVDSEQWLAQHPTIRSELAREFEKARRIHDALADDPSLEASTPSIIGRYRVESLLGQGSFGRVYLAVDDELSRRVAIKVPHVHRWLDAESAASYLAEARLLAKLDHPGIVPVFDVGRAPEIGCYVVSKWIAGTDLGSRLRAGSLSIEQAVRLLIDLAEALHYAHSRQVVHRDIKPANILVTPEGRGVLADFGLAIGDQLWTRDGERAGTPAYMSPEQARGEAHRVDGRSDLFSLGVVFYELLAGEKPFQGASREALLEQVISYDPPPPSERRRVLRQSRNETFVVPPSGGSDPLKAIPPTSQSKCDEALGVPAELERICGKLLAKRAADRYATAKDLLVDLRLFQREHRGAAGESSSASAAESSSREVADSSRPGASIVPKGLRCFDAADAPFFCELLPGPRDRRGVPESLRWWKSRVESLDADDAFSVGLLYGPSGCGKSSWLRAGLLPLLGPHVRTVVIEATPDETESQLLGRLHRLFPGFAEETSLSRLLARVRRGEVLPPGQKLLLVIDQFEQWLSGRADADRRGLVEPLRQCDGERVQGLLAVRDDFWLAISRFMVELEIDLTPGRNTALLDLFDPRHATKVLTEFGRAYGKLPQVGDELTRDQRQFLEGAIHGLSEEGKIIPVRLALFAEMFKNRPWTPAELSAVGGSAGIGATFLEEMFGARSTDQRHRVHEKGARRVLAALLPSPGSPIRGHVRSKPELLDLSGYGDRPREFKELMRILDQETRLLTPAERVTDGESSSSLSPAVRYYQLTHDYLVPSLREWLTRKQRSTPAGRAELLLVERSALWNSTRERRQLPTLWEWLTIQTMTRSRGRTESQRRMLRAAAQRHLVAGFVWSAAAMVAVLVGAELAGSARELLLRVRAETAPLWFALGNQEVLVPLLQHGSDPTIRTQVMHQLNPFLVSPVRLVEQAGSTPEPSVRRALLMAAGEMETRREHRVGTAAESPRLKVDESLLQRIVELYQRDPDPGVHAAAGWALRQFADREELLRLDASLRTNSSPVDRQWYVTTEGQTLVMIPGPARFLMGAAAPNDSANPPPSLQTIRRSFSIASKETTEAQFLRFLAANPLVARGLEGRAGRSADSPRTHVSWYEAAAYCNWLSERESIPREQWCFEPNEAGEYAEGMVVATDWWNRQGYRLATEAEWEYASRAGAETTWHFGRDSQFIAEFARIRGEELEPSPVGSHKPNDFGLFDTIGNASEWCLDCLFTTSTANGSERVGSQTRRAARGGSFQDDPNAAACTSRLLFSPEHRSATVGFRIARSYP